MLTMKTWTGIIILFTLWNGVFSKTCQTASFCLNQDCNPPYCFCSGNEPNIPLRDRPQLVFLTFDDAFTAYARNNFYKKIFEGSDAIKNPNGRPIRATHFLTHKYTSYPDVHYYYSKLGHEMASHSITHLDNITYWTSLNVNDWDDEMYGMTRIMSKFGGIDEKDIKGMRAPFLQIGGDKQFRMAKRRFEYDCSMPSRRYGYTNLDNGLWPYTLDFKSIQDCQVAPCPNCMYPNLWVQPMLDLEDMRLGIEGSQDGQPCAMLDSCVIPSNLGKSPELVYDMLMKSFNRSYYGNTRAPFGVYMHAAWFVGQDWHFKGYESFLRKITELQDVWIVPVSAGIEYMKNPIPNSILHEFEPFKGDPKTFPKFNCPIKQSCRYVNVSYSGLEIQEIYMSICGAKCPSKYPWLRNEEGQSFSK